MTPPSTAQAVIPAPRSTSIAAAALPTRTGHEHDRTLAVQRHEPAGQLVEWDRTRTRDARQVDLVRSPQVDPLNAPVCRSAQAILGASSDPAVVCDRTSAPRLRHRQFPAHPTAESPQTPISVTGRGRISSLPVQPRVGTDVPAAPPD
jgi:hypothetical protein